jgi:hypothetical protein
MGVEPGEAGYDKVGRTLTAVGIRLFGFQLGRLYTGIYSLGVAPGPGGVLLPRATVDPTGKQCLTSRTKRAVFSLEKTPKATLDEDMR